MFFESPNKQTNFQLGVSGLELSSGKLASSLGRLLAERLDPLKSQSENDGSTRKNNLLGIAVLERLLLSSLKGSSLLGGLRNDFQQTNTPKTEREKTFSRARRLLAASASACDESKTSVAFF